MFISESFSIKTHMGPIVSYRKYTIANLFMLHAIATTKHKILKSIQVNSGNITHFYSNSNISSKISKVNISTKYYTGNVYSNCGIKSCSKFWGFIITNYYAVKVDTVVLKYLCQFNFICFNRTVYPSKERLCKRIGRISFL